MVVSAGSCVYYVGSGNNSTTFIISHFTNGRLVGAIGKENAVVMNVKDKDIVVNLHSETIYDNSVFNRNDDGLLNCSSGIQLYGIYNYISGSGSKHDVTTHCKTRLVDAKNARVRQSNQTCQDRDCEVRVVNENNVHYRGSKKTIFIVGENTGSAEIKDGSLVKIKNNTDIIYINGTDVTQLKIIENAGNNYSLELLDNSTQSIVSSVKVDNFENLMLEVESPGVKSFVTVHDKSLFDIAESMKYQISSNLTENSIDVQIIQSKIKATVQINDTRRVNVSAYEVARDVIDNNNLGVPISLVQVEKVMDNVTHEAIVENIYHNEIVADFGRENINCKKVISVETEQHGGKCIVKFPQTCEPDNPVDLILRVITLPYASASDKMFDLTECGISPEDIEVKGGTTGIILNSHVNQGSFQVVLDNYLRGLEYQHIAFQFNKGSEIYKVNSTSLRLEPVLYNYEKKKWVDYGVFKYYEPGEQGLQIYHNQPKNESRTGFIDLKDKSISYFDMRIVGNSLILLSRNDTVVKVENWVTCKPARKMIFAFNDTIGANAKCTTSTVCNPEVIIKKFKKKKEEKEKPIQRKRRHQPRHHIREQRYLHGEEDLESRGNSRSIENDNYVIRNNKATSGASKPSSWINVFANSIVDAVKSIPRFIFSSFKPAVGIEHFQTSKAMTTQGVDVNGTLLLLDVFIRKITGQKYISSSARSIPEQEALGYALNIMEGFKKVVEQARLKSGVSMHRLNIDFVKVQEEVTRKITGDKFSEIAEILNSYVEKACPGREAGCTGKLSSRKFDKFMAEFNNGLDAALNQPMQQILSRGSTLKASNVKEQQISLEPRSYLNDTSVQGHLTQDRGLRN